VILKYFSDSFDKAAFLCYKKSMKNGRNLALFDFDGTVTSKDSFLDLSVHILGKCRFYLMCLKLFPFIVLYFLKIVSGKKLKEMFLTRMIKGMSEKEFDSIVCEYTEAKMPGILKNSALIAIKTHRDRGDETVLVSASGEQWLKHFARNNGMELIATKLEAVNGTFTGKIEGENCYGPEKVRRIREIYDPASFEHIFAYGDSEGDRDMLGIADRKFYRYFK